MQEETGKKRAENRKRKESHCDEGVYGRPQASDLLGPAVLILSCRLHVEELWHSASLGCLCSLVYTHFTLKNAYGYILFEQPAALQAESASHPKCSKLLGAALPAH